MRDVFKDKICVYRKDYEKFVEKFIKRFCSDKHHLKRKMMGITLDKAFNHKFKWFWEEDGNDRTR